jgi:hypothetical protein
VQAINTILQNPDLSLLEDLELFEEEEIEEEEEESEEEEEEDSDNDNDNGSGNGDGDNGDDNDNGNGNGDDDELLLPEEPEEPIEEEESVGGIESFEIITDGCFGGGYYADDSNPRCYPIKKNGELQTEPPEDQVFCAALGCFFNPPDLSN